MGIAASQARYLYLTARQVTVEFEGQQLNQARTMLANESAGLFRELSELECPTQQTYYSVQSQCKTWANAEPQGPQLTDTNTDGSLKYPGGKTDPQYIKDMEMWNAYLTEYQSTGDVNSAYTSAYNVSTTQYNNDKTEYDKASAEIEAKSEKIQQQDQALELQLRQLDTERQTITTELDSVKKVLDKNIEQVFKTFQS